MTIYQIFHCYDVDGGFGDAVSEEDIIGATLDENEANEYVKKWSKPEIYDKPYASLYRHELIVRPIEIGLDINKNPFEEEVVY